MLMPPWQYPSGRAVQSASFVQFPGIPNVHVGTGRGGRGGQASFVARCTQFPSHETKPPLISLGLLQGNHFGGVPAEPSTPVLPPMTPSPPVPLIGKPPEPPLVIGVPPELPDLPPVVPTCAFPPAPLLPITPPRPAPGSGWALPISPPAVSPQAATPAERHIAARNGPAIDNTALTENLLEPPSFR
jgi:hypothetical protein